MRFKITLLLILANLVTFGMIWRMERERARPPAAEAPLFPAGMQKIAVEGPGVPHPYTLEKHQHGWRITSPFQWEANTRSVEGILEQLRFLHLDRSFTVQEAEEDGNSLAAYGLADPQVLLTVQGEAAQPVRISIGKPVMDSTSGPIYLLTPDQRIIPALQTLLGYLTVSPEKLRMVDVFSMSPFEVNDLTIWAKASGAAVERHVGLKREQISVPGEVDLETVWRFETPLAADADANLVQARLVRLAGLRYENFSTGTSERLEQSGLVSPAMRISLAGSMRQQTLLVGHKQSDSGGTRYFAKLSDNPAIFTVPAAAIDVWSDAETSLRERRFFKFHMPLLREITIHEGGNSLMLHRRIDGAASAGVGEWTIPMVPGTTATVTMAADPDVMRELIGALHDLSAEDFIPETPLPAEQVKWTKAFVSDAPTPEELTALKLDRPVRKVDLNFSNGTQSTLLIAAPAAPNTPHHAKLGDKPSLYSISPAILDRLSVNPYQYRMRLVEQLPADAQITGVRLTDLAAKKVLVEVRRPAPDASWDAVLQETFPAEAKLREAVLRLLDLPELRTIRAVLFERGGFSPDFSKHYLGAKEADRWRYQMELTFRVADAAAEETRSWFFTRRLGGTVQIGGSPAQNCIFHIQQPLIDALFPLTLGRDRSRDIPVVNPPEDLPPLPTASQ